jgi:hypothetical protein
MGALLEVLFRIVLFLTKWLLILSWRFFTGAHMTGNHFNDSSFWRDATNAKKRAQARPRQYSWWKRKARYKRMLWRNGIFWPVLLLVIGFMWDWSSMLMILGFLGIPSWWIADRRFHMWHRFRLLFQLPYVATESNGHMYQRWAWKTSYRRMFRRLRQIRQPKENERWHPGIATPAELRGEPRLVELTPDMERAVRAELAEELPPGGPIELRLLLDPDFDHT